MQKRRNSRALAMELVSFASSHWYRGGRASNELQWLDRILIPAMAVGWHALLKYPTLSLAHTLIPLLTHSSSEVFSADQFARSRSHDHLGSGKTDDAPGRWRWLTNIAALEHRRFSLSSCNRWLISLSRHDSYRAISWPTSDRLQGAPVGWSSHTNQKFRGTSCSGNRRQRLSRSAVSAYHGRAQVAPVYGERFSYLCCTPHVQIR